jgi:hypothetical protein
MLTPEIPQHFQCRALEQGHTIAGRFSGMVPGKPTSQLEAFIRLVDALLSVPSDKIQVELQRVQRAKTYASGKIALEGTVSENARRWDP